MTFAEIGDAVYRRVTDRLPPGAAARLDLLRPSARNPWGGPFNGQERRCELVHELASKTDFDLVLETGTYRGTTTEFLLTAFGPPVSTVEVNPRYFAYSRRRLARLTGVHLELGDSRDFLRRQLAPAIDGRAVIFIYLDAHWRTELPLVDELRIIAQAREDAVVMVDDFRVPGDPGYGFDDYGPGRRLSEEILPAEDLPGWSLSYPSAPSNRETGAVRGCCVLASPSMTESIRVPSLRLEQTL